MSESKILALAVGDATVPSTRYRLLKLLPYLQAHQFKVDVVEPARRRAARYAQAASIVARLGGADLVLIQKRLVPRVLIRAISATGTPIVFDLDDALFVDPARPGTASPESARLESIVRSSDLVIAGNAYLAEWARELGTPVRQIPTAVDASRWSPSVLREHAGVVLGWIGTSSNLWHLEAIADGIVAALDAVPSSRLVVVCDRPAAIDHPAVEFRQWSLESELRSVADFDIGLMPLSDDPWTRGKCAFKALQCMALGLPVIAAAVGANNDVIDDGRTGILVHGPDDWTRRLLFLMQSADVRTALGHAARERVLGSFDLQRAGHDMAEALKDVIGGSRHT